MKKRIVCLLMTTACLLLGGCEVMMGDESSFPLPSGRELLAEIEREKPKRLDSAVWGSAAWSSADLDPADLDPALWDSADWDPALWGSVARGQSGERVKCLVSEEGEIPLTFPVEQYCYRLPMIDLAGRQALACNREIDSVYGSLIQASKDAMERFELPTLESLRYAVFVHGDILTLRIDRQDYNGPFTQAYYTVNAETGDSVSVQELFAAIGLSGEVEQILNQAVTELFVRRFGSIEDADLAYTTALNQTQTALLEIGTNQMHLTELGQLSLSLTVYQPQGGSMREELLLP